jgi:hypothetical protein
MRKPRKQPALTGLNQDELDQIVRWLHGSSYDAVLERIAKPRPEGFGLNISRGPLQRLYEKATTRLLEQHLYAKGLNPFSKLMI